MFDLPKIIIEAFKKQHFLFLCGNGGSAAEADHMAAELVGQFSSYKRQALPAIALSCSGAILTSLGNDRGYNQVFSRQIEAYGREGDILLVFTTSDAKEGHTQNLMEALITARRLGIKTAGLVSKKKTKLLLKFIDYPILVEGEETSQIQEKQIKVLHRICDKIDKAFL